jgi:hypothetical protein
MSAATASGTSRETIVRDGDEFTVDGRRFRLEIRRDDDMGEPWKEHDGHGVVSEWTGRKKKPGERVLHEDRRSYRYYDVQASIERAFKDWVGTELVIDGKTRGQRAAAAVEADFERLRRWCNDDWYWVYLKVTLLDGRNKGEFETLGGVESDAEAYISESAHELAGELLNRVVTNGGEHG